MNFMNSISVSLNLKLGKTDSSTKQDRETKKMTNYNDFRAALQFVLKWEGGYVNDPKDPGGETKWGISKKAHPDIDIKNLTPEKAAEIYAQEYWDRAGCDGMVSPLNIAVFDTAVNCGVNRAVAWARSVKTAEEYLKLRKEYYIGLATKNPNLQKFLKGWLNRLNDLCKLVEVIANQEPPKE